MSDCSPHSILFVLVLLNSDTRDLIKAILLALEEEKVIQKADEDKLFDDLCDWEKYLDAITKLLRFSHYCVPYTRVSSFFLPWNSLICDSVLAEGDADALLQFVLAIYSFVTPYSKKPEEGHRLTATSIIGELVLHVEVAYDISLLSLSLFVLTL